MAATSTAATTIPDLRWPPGVVRGATALVALAVLASCGGGDDHAEERPTAEEVVVGDLHECAAGWPVPDGIRVVDTSLGRDQAGERTCVVSLQTGRSVAEAATAYVESLDSGGWQYEVRQRDPDAAMLDLAGPRCGVMLVLPEEAETSVLVSLIDCERVRERPPT